MSCDLFVFETWCTDILHIYWNETEIHICRWIKNVYI